MKQSNVRLDLVCGGGCVCMERECEFVCCVVVWYGNRESGGCCVHSDDVYILSIKDGVCP